MPRHAATARRRSYLTRPVPARPRLTPNRSRFASFLMLFFGHLDAEKGLTKQLHWERSATLIRGDSAKPAPTTGYDSVGDWEQPPLSAPILTCWRRNMHSRRPSSIPSTRRIITFSPLPWAISGRFDRGQNAVRQRLVVSRPEGRDRMATECALKYWFALALHWNAD